MALKSDQNFEETLTFFEKNDMRTLMNFNSSSRKPEKLALSWGIFAKSM